MLRTRVVCVAYDDVSKQFTLLSLSLYNINKSYSYAKQCHSEPYNDVISTKTTADKLLMLARSYLSYKDIGQYEILY